MYKVLCDNALMCDSGIEELVLIDPVVKLEENKAGSFSFIIPPEHPKYDAIKKRKSLIQVYRDDEQLFSGVCVEETKDFYKRKKVNCEGELTFFNDSIQRPARHEGKTVQELLEIYTANHNAQVEVNKRFTVGVVNVQDSNDYISCYTNMESTMTALKEDLLDDFGGILRIRHENNARYLDYLAESPNTNSQVIRLGENLVDFKSNLDTVQIATAVIPLGAKLEESKVEGLDTRLTIEAVNGGLDYVYNQDAVNTYGWIYKIVEFDDVTTPEALKSKGEKYLSEIQFENMVLEAKAIDLHLADKENEQFKISDMVRVVSIPHGLDKFFRLTKMTINLNNPEKDTITLGKSKRLSLSAKNSQVGAELKKALDSISRNSLLQEAARNATALITSAMGGYVVKTNDELLIMDTDNIKTAKKVWRWNINGLSYSSTGYDGEYTLAMTMDGQLVADIITAGTMSADRVRGGTLIAGGVNDEFGRIEVQDNKGNIIGKWDRGGLTAEGELISAAIDYWDYNNSIKSILRKGALYLEDGSGNLIGVLERHKISADADAGAVGLFSNMSALRLGFIHTIEDGGESTDTHWCNVYYTIYNPETDTAENAIRHLFSENALFMDDLTCEGVSTIRITTPNKGKRKLINMASAEAYFVDMGTGVIGSDGTCTVTIEEIFSETVDLEADYQVFIAPTSQTTGLWTAKSQEQFIVHGTEGVTFDWAIYCKQSGRSDIRLEKVEGL